VQDQPQQEQQELITPAVVVAVADIIILVAYHMPAVMVVQE
jgi:hypothetical protein